MILYNGDEINNLAMAAAAGDNEAFTLDVECRDGYELSAMSPDPGVTIWAKANPGDSFQNIGTTPLDLSSFAPAIKTIYFECRVDSGEPAESLIYEITAALPG